MQFYAIFLDAIRLLRAKALFWITLGISVFAALLYLSIGFDEHGITLLFGLTSLENEVIREGSPLAEMFYLAIFSLVIVNLWLSWIAIILALITCAPIFPSFMSEGNAGAVLCKPISRLKLFFYKYLAGLLFAFLQTSLFCLIVFFAIRLRVGTWNPTIFWAVPLIVLMFSYLWSVMVVIGIRTRSTMAAVLVSIFVWFLAWVAAFSENYAWYIVEFKEYPASPIAVTDSEHQKWQSRYSKIAIPYQILPKTSDTINLLHRLMRVQGDREFSVSELSLAMSGQTSQPDDIPEETQRHSTFFIIGSSLTFEFLLMGFAAWSFCRRDF